MLQNTLTFFRQEGALLASVREVARQHQQGEVFRLFDLHSVHSNRVVDEVRFPPVLRSDGSLAWRCIDLWSVLTYDALHCRDLAKPVHYDSRRVESGVCIPLVTWTGRGCVKWAFCVDFC